MNLQNESFAVLQDANLNTTSFTKQGILHLSLRNDT